jgi:hypothetical protein
MPSKATSNSVRHAIAARQRWLTTFLALREIDGASDVTDLQANLIELPGTRMTTTALEVVGEVVTVLRKRGQDPLPFVDIMTQTMLAAK